MEEEVKWSIQRSNITTSFPCWTFHFLQLSFELCFFLIKHHFIAFHP